jgi:GxxExxY protein
MIADKNDYLYKDLTYQVIECLYEVHRELGSVHKEIIYHKALAIELERRRIPFTEETAIDVNIRVKRLAYIGQTL